MTGNPLHCFVDRTREVWYGDQSIDRAIEEAYLRPHDGHAGEHREPRPFSARRTDSQTLADTCGTGSLADEKERVEGKDVWPLSTLGSNRNPIAALPCPAHHALSRPVPLEEPTNC